MVALKTARTEALEIAFLEHGSPSGWPVVLSHRFPDDVHAFDDAAPHLAQAGARVIVPYLRGFGPTWWGSVAGPRRKTFCARSKWQTAETTSRFTPSPLNSPLPL
jgi:pimeloyl-ACP methyl ester carboxylesterase